MFFQHEKSLKFDEFRNQIGMESSAFRESLIGLLERFGVEIKKD